MNTNSPEKEDHYEDGKGADKTNENERNPDVKTDANGVALFEDSIKRTDDILAASKALASAVKKIDKKREDEESARSAVRALQEEANQVLNAKLENESQSGMRDFETVQKEMLKAHNKVDKAIDNANKEREKSEAAYHALLSILLPEKGYSGGASSGT